LKKTVPCQTWIEDDVEISVRTKEAKKHLDVLEEDVKVLQSQLQEADDTASPSKRVNLRR